MSTRSCVACFDRHALTVRSKQCTSPGGKLLADSTWPKNFASRFAGSSRAPVGQDQAQRRWLSGRAGDEGDHAHGRCQRYLQSCAANCAQNGQPMYADTLAEQHRRAERRAARVELPTIGRWLLSAGLAMKPAWARCPFGFPRPVLVTLGQTDIHEHPNMYPMYHIRSRVGQQPHLRLAQVVQTIAHRYLRADPDLQCRPLLLGSWVSRLDISCLIAVFHASTGAASCSR